LQSTAEPTGEWSALGLHAKAHKSAQGGWTSRDRRAPPTGTICMPSRHAATCIANLCLVQHCSEQLYAGPQASESSETPGVLAPTPRVTVTYLQRLVEV
jgi:hypothetical protein